MIGAFTQPGRTDFQSSLVTLADWLRKSARPNIVTTFDLELPRCRDDLGNAEKLELGVEPIAELRTHLIEMSIRRELAFYYRGTGAPIFFATLLTSSSVGALSSCSPSPRASSGIPSAELAIGSSTARSLGPSVIFDLFVIVRSFCPYRKHRLM